MHGDDGAGGALAATLPYMGRLARRVGELTGAGDPVAFEAAADVRVSVDVSWNLAGEGAFRAVVASVPPRVPAQYTLVGGSEMQAALQHCVRRVSSLPGMTWAGGRQHRLGGASGGIGVCGEAARATADDDWRRRRTASRKERKLVWLRSLSRGVGPN